MMNIVQRLMTETHDEAQAGDALAASCAVELIDAWISIRATTPQYLRVLECPMPESTHYGQLGLALQDAGHAFTFARLSAFNESWGRRFYERQRAA